MLTSQIIQPEKGLVNSIFNHLYNKLKNKIGTGLYVGFIGADDKKMDLVSEIAGDMIDFEKGETIIHGLLG